MFGPQFNTFLRSIDNKLSILINIFVHSKGAIDVKPIKYMVQDLMDLLPLVLKRIMSV